MNVNLILFLMGLLAATCFGSDADSILNQLKTDQASLNIYIMEDEEASIKEGLRDELTKEDIIKILKWNIKHDFKQYALYKMSHGNLDNLYQMLKVNNFLKIDEVIAALLAGVSERDIVEFVKYTNDYDFNSLTNQDNKSSFISTLKSNHESKIRGKTKKAVNYYDFEEDQLDKIFRMKKDVDIKKFEDLKKRNELTDFEGRMENIFNVAPHVDLENVLGGLDYDLNLDEICTILKMNFPNPNLQKIGELRKTLPDHLKNILKPNVLRTIFQDTKNGMPVENLWKKFGFV